MITYVYQCQNCQHSFEVEQSIHDKPKKRCPVCLKHKLERVLQPVHVIVSQEATTLGQLAERNTKKMSKDELESKRNQLAQEKEQANTEMLKQILPPGSKIPEVSNEKPWYGRPDKETKQKIIKADAKKKQKFIMEGTI